MPTRTTWTQWRLQTAHPSCSSLAAMMLCARCGTGGPCGRTDRSRLVIWLATETASPSSIARFARGKALANYPSVNSLLFLMFVFFLNILMSILPGWCTISHQQLQGSVHQALGHQEVLPQRGAGSFAPGRDPAKLGLSLAAGSPERWGETGLLGVVKSAGWRAVWAQQKERRVVTWI